MSQEVQCPFCKRTVKLTPFVLLAKHTRGKGRIVCCGSGYTLEEAARIANTKYA